MGKFPNKKISQIRKPVDTMFFTDGWRNWIGCWNQYFYVRHQKVVNMVMADGHVHQESFSCPDKTRCGSAGAWQYPMSTSSLAFPWLPK